MDQGAGQHNHRRCRGLRTRGSAAIAVAVVAGIIVMLVMSLVGSCRSCGFGDCTRKGNSLREQCASGPRSVICCDQDSGSRLSSLGTTRFLPTLKDQPSSALGIAGGITVALAIGYDRSLHQHMPNVCEPLRIAQLCVLRQGLDDRTNLRQMDRGSAMHRAIDLGFEQNVDERAALERTFAKPAIKDVEDRQ